MFIVNLRKVIAIVFKVLRLKFDFKLLLQFAFNLDSLIVKVKEYRFSFSFLFIYIHDLSNEIEVGI